MVLVGIISVRMLFGENEKHSWILEIVAAGVLRYIVYPKAIEHLDINMSIDHNREMTDTSVRPEWLTASSTVPSIWLKLVTWSGNSRRRGRV